LAGRRSVVHNVLSGVIGISDDGVKAEKVDVVSVVQGHEGGHVLPPSGDPRDVGAQDEIDNPGLDEVDHVRPTRTVDREVGEDVGVGGDVDHGDPAVTGLSAAHLDLILQTPPGAFSVGSGVDDGAFAGVVAGVGVLSDVDHDASFPR
jgi:hypothetical protein